MIFGRLLRSFCDLLKFFGPFCGHCRPLSFAVVFCDLSQFLVIFGRLWSSSVVFWRLSLYLDIIRGLSQSSFVVCCHVCTLWSSFAVFCGLSQSLDVFAVVSSFEVLCPLLWPFTVFRYAWWSLVVFVVFCHLSLYLVIIRGLLESLAIFYGLLSCFAVFSRPLLSLVVFCGLFVVFCGRW
jgi:hypothetical protein